MISRSSAFKLLMCCAAVVASTTASAAIIQCPTRTTLANLLAIASAPGDGCQNQDKIFSNFTYTLGAPDAAFVRATLQFLVGAGQDLHGWTFAHSGSWTSGFTLSYLITVVPGQAAFILASKDQINTGIIPNGTANNDRQTDRKSVV